MSDTPTNTTGATPAASGDNSTTTPPATTTPAPQINLTEFAASLDRLGESLGGKLDGLHETVRSGTESSAPSPEPVDLETLSRPELVAHVVTTVMDAVKAQLAESLQPVTQQLQGLQTDYAARNAQSEVASLKEANKDFTDWKDDMIGLAKQPQYASLSITDLYQLARAKNPTKAAELATKYNPPPPPKPTRPTFGGLTNASFTPGNGAKALSPRDAGIEAYREVQARHSDVLPALESL